MIKVIPFEPEHIMGMEPLMDDACTKAIMQSSEYLQALKQLGQIGRASCRERV